MPGSGRYTILRKIADGGMAEIFLARQHGAEGFERPVVLKRILAALLADPQFKNLLVDEAHVAMSLHDGNIVQVLDLGESKGRTFLVMELVDGWDLNHVLHRLKPLEAALPPALALFITAEVCRALAYAHSRTRDGKPLGIVHRDVSPHNVLVSEQGEVKLTDFGIAKALGRREQTTQGVIKGKLAFMSPEQASGAVLDGRSDLFSVGTMLYLMTTGKRPFEGPTDLETLLRVRQCDFPAPSAVRPDLPLRLADLIAKSMRLRPSERYQTADEMLVDVETVQRTVFEPAGRTELKRWLAELYEKDRVPPVSRADARLPSDAEGEVLSLVGGTEASLAGIAPPPLPGAPPDGGGDASRPSGVTTAHTPSSRGVRAATPSGGRRGAIAGILAAGAAAAGLYALRRGAKTPAPAPPPSVPKRVNLEPFTVIAERDAGEIAANDAAPPPPDVADALPVPPAEDDEEHLLQRAESDIDDKVIDAPEPPPGARKRPAPPNAKKPEPPIVSVRVSTTPTGAIIKMKERVFGRAPMNLRFRAGITYELSFVKQGYVTASRRFRVTTRKNQKVAVTLRKKSPPPPKKKGFFQRLFE